MLFTVVGIIIAIIGVISGIVSWIILHSFLYCALIWIGTFLYALIFFGIGLLLKGQENLSDKLSSIIQTNDNILSILNSSKKVAPKEDENQPNDNISTKSTAHLWQCPKCGSKNLLTNTKCWNCNELKP